MENNIIETEVKIEESSSFNPESIANQNLKYALWVNIISFITSIIIIINSFFYPLDKLNIYNYILYLFAGIIGLLVWLSFKKYLKNLKAFKTINWINWIIGINIFFIFLGILGLFFINSLINDNKDTSTTNTIIMRIIMGIPYNIIMLGTGINLIKIKNDNVGLLKELGLSMILIYPITFALNSFFNIEVINILTTLIYLIPSILMIIIFKRAIEFVKTK